MRIIHFRAFDDDGNVLANCGATVAVERITEGNMFVYSFAICSPRDNFNRKIGRTIAEGRMRHANEATASTPASADGRHVSVVDSGAGRNLSKDDIIQMKKGLLDMVNRRWHEVCLRQKDPYDGPKELSFAKRDYRKE